MAHDLEETRPESKDSYVHVASRSDSLDKHAFAISPPEDESDGSSDTANVEARDDSATESKECKRDDTFFFSLVAFRVEDRLFRVPRDAFESQSEYFRELFTTKARTVVEDNCGDINEPMFLEGIDKDAFRDLLRLLYPPSRTSSFAGRIFLTREQWIKVLNLAQLWKFTGIRTLAIQELESIKLEEVEKLELALKYNIKQWYADAYLALAKRPGPLSVEEGQRLGLGLALKMSAVRERRLARMMEASPTKATPGFAPYAGTFVSFVPGKATASSASATSAVQPSQASTPCKSFQFTQSVKLPEFGKPGFGFSTTSEKSASSNDTVAPTDTEPSRKCSTCQSEGISDRRWNVDYDDIQLKHDIKQVFGL